MIITPETTLFYLLTTLCALGNEAAWWLDKTFFLGGFFFFFWPSCFTELNIEKEDRNSLTVPKKSQNYILCCHTPVCWHLSWCRSRPHRKWGKSHRQQMVPTMNPRFPQVTGHWQVLSSCLHVATGWSRGKVHSRTFDSDFLWVSSSTDDEDMYILSHSAFATDVVFFSLCASHSLPLMRCVNGSFQASSERRRTALVPSHSLPKTNDLTAREVMHIHAIKVPNFKPAYNLSGLPL